MPQLIRHIDAIARQKQRDVLFVVFHHKTTEATIDDEWHDIDWMRLPVRNNLIEWLNAQAIGWEKCAGYADVSTMESYHGQIYIDVPFDESNPVYQQLQNYLEFPDGTGRYREMMFCYDTLAHAMENAEHDEPGFWAKWAEDF